MATILIVDDLSANRDLLVTILRHQGHRMVEAADGAAGLAVARAEHPDLVITDVLMPVMDGYELVRQLRRDAVTHVRHARAQGPRGARRVGLAGCTLRGPRGAGTLCACFRMMM